MSQVSQIKNIQGPVSFRYLTNGTQNIYLFGDMHIRSNKECPDSQNIVDVLKSVTQAYDLYVEGAPNHAHDDFELTNYLRDVLKLVNSNNVINVKYSDARHIFFDYFLVGLLQVFGLLSEYYRDDVNITNQPVLISYINNIIDALKIYYEHQEETNNISYDTAWTFKKMGIIEEFKTFSKSNPENSRNAQLLVDNFFHANRADYFNEKGELLIQDDMNEVLNLLGPLFFTRNKRGELKTKKESAQNMIIFWRFMKSKIQKNNNIFEKIHTTLAQLSGLYMDFYLLFNFLRNNNTNNVIYAGEWHILNYVTFFKGIGFSEIYSTADINQCVSIGDNPLPLFTPQQRTQPTTLRQEKKDKLFKHMDIDF